MKNNNIYDSKKKKGSHYTPSKLARFIARSLWSSMDIPEAGEIKVLDPSCGDGELLKAIISEAPQDHVRRVRLYGIDQDEEAVAQAYHRLNKLCQSTPELEEGDFLKLCINASEQPNLFEEHISLPRPHAIIANPPYVRTQVMGAQRSQKLSEAFDLNGRVDLYQAFLVAIHQTLRPGGSLGIITSNKFLSTKSGSSTRSLLSKRFNIKKLIDFGDTDLFDAAVLPAVVIADKCDNDSSKGGRGRFVKIYKSNNPEEKNALEKYESIYNIVDQGENGIYEAKDTKYRVSTGFLNIPKSNEEPWSLLNNDEHKWITSIDKNAHFRFGDLVDVRVGIKTTADKVFIRDDWDDLPESLRPEPELLHPLLTPKNTRHWLAERETSRKVLYTHYSDNGERRAIDLEDYPKAAAYLKEHYDRLWGREYVREAGRNWYEVWVPHDPDAWQKPKLVFPDISDEPRFVFDSRGSIVKGNCYWIALGEEQPSDTLFLLQGLANSDVMTRYHDLVFNNKLYSGRRRYLTQYVEKYPVPNPESSHSKKIIRIVKRIISQKNVRNIDELTESLNCHISDAFGISDSDALTTRQK